MESENLSLPAIGSTREKERAKEESEGSKGGREKMVAARVMPMAAIAMASTAAIEMAMAAVAAGMVMQLRHASRR